MSTPRQQIVFLSRTTNGLAETALKCEAILKERGLSVIHQPDFTGSWRDVKGMLCDKLIECDAVICLIGPACGMMMKEPVTGLRDERTGGRHFSYTQLEYLVARDLPRPVFTYLCSGGEVIAPLTPETAEQEKSQRDFIEEFAKDGSNVRVSCDTWAKLEDDLRRISIPRTVSAGRPCNLPYATLGSLFKGRDSFLADLRARLTSESAAIIKGHAIHGTGGVGKTAAAIEYAWRFAGAYRALLFVNADTPEALEQSLARLCAINILNLPEQDVTDQNIQVAAALKWLERHQDWLLIIDNADSKPALAAAQQHLASLSNGHVIFTTRLDIKFGQIEPLDLNVLTEDASAELLRDWTKDQRTKSTDDESCLKELAVLLDGLALALRQAAAYICECRITFREYLTRWHQHTPDALAWHDPLTMHYPRSLAITYQTSVAQLTPAALSLFQQLAWFAPDPIPFSLMESGHAPENGRALLAELENLHLARRREDGSAFSLHRLIQEITRQQQNPSTVARASSPQQQDPSTVARASSPQQQDPSTVARASSPQQQDPSTVARASSPQQQEDFGLEARATVVPPALLAALQWVNDAMPTDTDDVRTWPVAVPLLPHALATATSAADHHLPDPTDRLLSCAALLLNTQANYRAAEPHFRRALALTEKAHGENAAEVAPHLNNLALLLKDTNRLAEAEPLMRRALAIDEASFGKDHPNVASSINNLAALLEAMGRVEGAEEMYRRALAIWEASLGVKHPQVAVGLSNLADTLRIAGNFAEAEPLMRRALAIDEASFGKDHPKVAIRLNNLAQLLKATNRLAEAEPLMRRALAIDEASFGNDHPNVAIELNNLAQLLQATNRLAEAEPLMRRALAIDEASFGKDHPNVAISLNNLARLLKATNRLAEAEPLMRRHLEIFVAFTVATGHRHLHLEVAIKNYGILLREMGDTEALAGEKIAVLMAPIHNQ